MLSSSITPFTRAVLVGPSVTGVGPGAGSIDEIDEEDEEDEDYSNLDEDSGEEQDSVTGQGSDDHD